VRIAYVTDVEGRWDKLAAFAADNPLVSLDAQGRLELAPGAMLVFGGDAVDRGPAGRRVLRALVDIKRREPERVVLLSGNRDLNKLRLASELNGRPHRKVPAEVAAGPRADHLRWIFSHTMGAHHAFEHRKAELAGARDEAIVSSFLEDVQAGGLLREYLLRAQLAFRSGVTLFVHGGVSDDSFGAVPSEPRVAGLAAWIEQLNAFHARQVAAFVEDPFGDPDAAGWGELMRYQAPVPGTRMNPESVVYGRPADENNHPVMLSERLRAALSAEGVHRVVVGHTPTGDCPTLMRDDAGFELVLGDNSYGRLEGGAQILLDDGALEVRGSTQLDDGRRVEVGFALERGDRDSLLGRALPSGRIVKARLAGGDYHLFRGLPDRKVEQLAASEEEVRREIG
jgi:hypothetical protein